MSINGKIGSILTLLAGGLDVRLGYSSLDIGWLGLLLANSG